MNYLIRIQRGIDYIEQHLDEEVALADVARAAAISQWHFQRIFKALTKETLKSYIRSRRMSMTLDKLLNTDTRIIDIALAAGYDSQEGFSRAFKQMFSLTPSEYRNIGQGSPFLKKLQLNREYLSHINDHISLEPELVTMEAMQFVGMRSTYYGPESEKNNIGNKLPRLWQNVLQRRDEISHKIPHTGYGIVRQIVEQDAQLEYFAAFQVSTVTTVADGMTVIQLPRTRYACFTHRGHPEKLDHTVNYIYSNWLLQTAYQHSYAADLEIYGPQYRPESADSIIYYAIPLLEI